LPALLERQAETSCRVTSRLGGANDYRRLGKAALVAQRDGAEIRDRITATPARRSAANREWSCCRWVPFVNARDSRISPDVESAVNGGATSITDPPLIRRQRQIWLVAERSRSSELKKAGGEPSVIAERAFHERAECRHAQSPRWSHPGCRDLACDSGSVTVPSV